MKRALKIELILLTILTALFLSFMSTRKTIDLNKATRAELISIPGIGPSLASRIILERTRRGGFRSMEDLLKISGIGRNTFKTLEKFLYVTNSDNTRYGEDNKKTSGACCYQLKTEFMEDIT